MNYLAFGACITFNSLRLREVPLRLVLGLVFLASGFSAERLAAQDQSVVDEVLRALSRYAEDLSLVAQVDVRLEGAHGGLREEGLFTYRSGSGRRLISFKRALVEEGSPTIRTQNDLVFLPDGSVLSCQAKLDDSLQQLFGDDYDPHLSLLLFSRSIAGKQKIDGESAISYFVELEPSIWWIGRTPLWLYLEGGASFEQTPLQDGHVLLNSENAYGEVSLEVGEADGWLPRKFRVVKRGNHRLKEGTALEWFTPKVVDADPSDVFPEGRGPEQASKSKGIREIIWEGTASQFSADSQNRWSAWKMHVKKTVSYFEKPPAVYLVQLDIESLEFSPSFSEGAFETSLVFPPDFEVTVDEAAHIPYKWDGKRPVPGISAPPKLDRQPLVAVGGPRLVGLIGINLLLLVAIVAVLFRFHRSKS